MTILYNLVFILFALVYLPYMVFTGKYHRDFKQRLGIFPQKVLKEIQGKDVIWVHAVSVGEVMAVRAFCESFLDKYPSKRLVISTVTKTGNDVARRLFDKKVTIIYLPLDLSWVVNRVLDKFMPKAFVMVETEIWPNLLNSLARRKVTVIMINGRISPKSFERYMMVKFFMKPILEKITLFCMQNRDYAERIKSIGAASDRVVVTGNMKFDAVSRIPSHIDVDALRSDLGLDKEEAVFIAGSTHPGEDEIVLDVYKKLLKEFPDLRLIIAPRHIERTKEIENLVKRANFTPVRISQTNHELRTTNHDNSVFILDTMGRLSQLYSIATLVFMGGSLIRKGGQNILEPAVLEKPIVFGPNMFNFADITRLFLNRHAACMVKDKEELLEISRNILSDTKLRESLAENAREAVEESLGASRKNLEKLEGYL